MIFVKHKKDRNRRRKKKILQCHYAELVVGLLLCFGLKSMTATATSMRRRYDVTTATARIPAFVFWAEVSDVNCQ